MTVSSNLEELEGFSIYATYGGENGIELVKKIPQEGLNDKVIYMRMFPNKMDESLLQAELSANHKLVAMKVGPFSLPNKNYKIFENQLLECIPNTKGEQ